MSWNLLYAILNRMEWFSTFRMRAGKSKIVEIAGLSGAVFGTWIASGALSQLVQITICCPQSLFASWPSSEELGQMFFGIILIMISIFLLANERKGTQKRVGKSDDESAKLKFGSDCLELA